MCVSRTHTYTKTSNTERFVCVLLYNFAQAPDRYTSIKFRPISKHRPGNRSWRNPIGKHGLNKRTRTCKMPDERDYMRAIRQLVNRKQNGRSRRMRHIELQKTVRNPIQKLEQSNLSRQQIIAIGGHQQLRGGLSSNAQQMSSS